MLACRNLVQAPSGCGTGLACRTCGAVNAILGALAGRSTVQECRIGTLTVDAFDLRIWASPFAWPTGHYTLVVATDISNEKRRQALERIFFHDILNTAGSVQGLAELMRDDPATFAELKEDLFSTAETLVNEIRSQRQLLQAEENTLEVTMLKANSRQVLEAVARDYRHHALAERREIALASCAEGFLFPTDTTLLHRVLGNLVKNALEATKAGDTVELGAEERADAWVFWCQNPGLIPPQVQAQMFQRSFSTKGPGRGLGTYSIRLLTERYLGGKVALVSTALAGTRVTLTFPRS